MNELLTPEPTEPSAEEGSTLNSQLLRLRGAADSMHTALLVWENHIDHPGARTAIHSAARCSLCHADALRRRRGPRTSTQGGGRQSAGEVRAD